MAVSVSLNTTALGESLSATLAFQLCWFRVAVAVFRIDYRYSVGCSA